MLTKQDIKLWIRSRSLKFMMNSHADKFGSKIEELYWKGKSISYRPGTSDLTIIHEVLLRPISQYWVPNLIEPNVILDIGAHIGISSVFFANRFPQSEVYSFEPIDENFSLLMKNIAGYRNIKTFPVALGKSDETKEIYASVNERNFGGYSFLDRGTQKQIKKSVQIKNTTEYLCKIGINKSDLIKIDAEGSEYDIVTAIDLNILKSTRWIIGELHGNHDFDVLAYLSQWFDISIKKPLKKRHFMFNACNKDWTSKIDKLIEFG
jgi:FkbM family methyltransferase